MINLLEQIEISLNLLVICHHDIGGYTGTGGALGGIRGVKSPLLTQVPGLGERDIRNTIALV